MMIALNPPSLYCHVGLDFKYILCLALKSEFQVKQGSTIPPPEFHQDDVLGEFETIVFAYKL